MHVIPTDDLQALNSCRPIGPIQTGSGSFCGAGRSSRVSPSCGESLTWRTLIITSQNSSFFESFGTGVWASELHINCSIDSVAAGWLITLRRMSLPSDSGQRWWIAIAAANSRNAFRRSRREGLSSYSFRINPRFNSPGERVSRDRHLMLLFEVLPRPSGAHAFGNEFPGVFASLDPRISSGNPPGLLRSSLRREDSRSRKGSPKKPFRQAQGPELVDGLSRTGKVTPSPTAGSARFPL